MLNRRSFLASLAATVASLAAWRPAWAQAQAKYVAQVTFLLTNDIYLFGDHPFPDGKSRGGFARLAAVVKAERAKGGHVIFAHGGDTLSPSLASSLDHGAGIITLTNMIAPDIFAPGNHEFDFGKATFLQRMREAAFPLYAANLRDADGSPLPGFKDRSILTVDGVRIGLTGLAFDRSPRVSSPEDLKFAETIATAREQGAALRREGADFVVAVMHCARGDALALQSTGAADLMLTGHTHDLFVDFTDDCAIVESGYDAHQVAAIDVTISVKVDGDKRQMSWWPQFRVIDTASVTPDPEVAAVIAQLDSAMQEKMSVPLATTAVTLDSRTAIVRTREAAIGNLFADAMRDSTRADAALLNGGGIRAGATYNPGAPISLGNVLAELPFNNRIVVVEMTGRALRQAIENGLSKLPQPSGRFPQVSGIAVEFDASRAAGGRILSMQVAGAPLVDDKTYRVAILDYLARGGDDYAMFRDATRITPDNDSPLLASEVAAYLRKIGTVKNTVEGRMVAK